MASHGAWIPEQQAQGTVDDWIRVDRGARMDNAMMNQGRDQMAAAQTPAAPRLWLDDAQPTNGTPPPLASWAREGVAVDSRRTSEETRDEANFSQREEGSGMRGGNRAQRRCGSSKEAIQTKQDSTFAMLEARGRKFDWRDLTYSPGVEVLGKGSMGTIYKASLRVCGGESRSMAVKQLHAADLGRSSADPAVWEKHEALLHEMTLGVQVKTHPNICEFIGAVDHPSHGALLLFELVEGVDMEEYFRRQKAQRQDWKPKLKCALEWGRQVFMALDALHTCEVPLMHRDVKPSNLMLCHHTAGEYASVKLIDFGLACEEVRGEQSQRQVDSFERLASVEMVRGCDMTALAGTYQYMAPEIVKGDSNYGTKADVYSGTMVLYFLITGTRPFEAVAPYVICQLTAIEGMRPPVESVRSPAVRELLALGWEAV